MLKSLLIVEIIVGALAIATGLLFVIGVFGQTEAELAVWGTVVVILGAVISLMGLIAKKAPGFIELGLVFILILAQIPAVFLWFLFNGSGISDGTPSAGFIAHWAYAAPHILIMLFGVVLMILLYKGKQPNRLFS